ncbi:hypothetical protein [Micromonospora sp. NPDC048830]|uniref:hypothetical protein n=1 Tax=Micromonospora sp. NPDC048830 TaxID=3364257 RepID=UPI00371337E1
MTDEEFDALTDRLHRGTPVALALPDEVALAHCPAGRPEEVANLLRSLESAGLTSVSLDRGEEMASEPEIGSVLRALTTLIAAPARARPAHHTAQELT